MSDFLQRMSERALGLAPVAQPIIASMFAPASPIPESSETLLELNEFVEAQPLPRPRFHAAAAISQPSPAIGASQQPGVAPPSPFVPPIDQGTDTPGQPLTRQENQAFPAPETESQPVSLQDTIVQPSNKLMRQEAVPLPEATPLTEKKPGAGSFPPQPGVYGQQAPAITAFPEAQPAPAQALPQVNEQFHHVPHAHNGAPEPAHPSSQAHTTIVEQERIVPQSRQPARTAMNISSPVRQQSLIVGVDQQDSSYPAQLSQEGNTIAPLPRAPSVLADTSASHDSAQISPTAQYDGSVPPERDLLMPETPAERWPATRRTTLPGDVLTYDVVAAGQPGRAAQEPRPAAGQHAAGVPETTGDVPTIRVTIGRVDVHAVTAPPTSRPRTSRTAPALSLADYARQNRKER